jgi:hypothetical protein
MADIYGALGLTDSDYAFVGTIGQSVVYDAALATLGDHNDDLAMAEAIFVEKTTAERAIKFKLAGDGLLQKRTSNAPTRYKKPNAGWDVAFPLDEWGTSLGWDRVTLAYTSIQQFNLALNGVFRQDKNTRRRQMLAAIFSGVSYVYKDENWPDATIQPLANGDTTLYPPVQGAMVDATANNYLLSGYVAGAIDDTHNPIPNMVNALETYFGTPTGGSPIVVFVNNAQTPAIQDLTDFTDVANLYISYGQNVSLVNELRFPAGIPGRIVGSCSGALIVEWRWIPANYMLGIHTDAPPPLQRRIDPPEVGLGDGLQLIYEISDQPIRSSHWTHRFGYAVANRLNGVVTQLTTDGSYTAPAPYATY